MTQELIAVTQTALGDDAVATVNARDLHAFLEVGKVFSEWIKDRIAQYGFVEGQDYAVEVPVPENQTGRGGDRRSRDYHISLDMAKELAMVERNEKGREARKYFIQCEKQLRSQVAIPQDEEEVARLYLAAVQEKKRLQQRIAANVLVPRPAVEETAEGIALQNIKRTIAPYLSVKVIAHVLKYFGQKRAIVQFGQHENAVVKPFVREGIEQAIQQFLTEAVKRISFSRKSVVLTHDCLLGDEAQVSREDAIQYLGYTAEQFED